MDDCASNPCQPGSTCNDLVGHYICQCPLGYTGQHCEVNIDDCGTGPSPCDNGGTCVDGIGSFTCECLVDFSGQACEMQKGKIKPRKRKTNLTLQCNTRSCTRICRVRLLQKHLLIPAYFPFSRLLLKIKITMNYFHYCSRRWLQ